MGFSIINHPFWGTLFFGNTHMISPWSSRTCHEPAKVSWFMSAFKNGKVKVNKCPCRNMNNYFDRATQNSLNIYCIHMYLARKQGHVGKLYGATRLFFIYSQHVKRLVLIKNSPLELLIQNHSENSPFRFKTMSLWLLFFWKGILIIQSWGTAIA